MWWWWAINYFQSQRASAAAAAESGAIHQFNVIISTAFMYSTESDDAPWFGECARQLSVDARADSSPNLSIHYSFRGISCPLCERALFYTNCWPFAAAPLMCVPPVKFATWKIHWPPLGIGNFNDIAFWGAPLVIKELLAFVGSELIQPPPPHWMLNDFGSCILRAFEAENTKQVISDTKNSFF